MVLLISWSLALVLLAVLPPPVPSFIPPFGSSHGGASKVVHQPGSSGCVLVYGLSWLEQQGGGEGGIPDLLGSRSLGLDWGHKKIGIGLSAGFSERPLGTIPNVGGLSENVTLHRPTLDRILTIAKSEGATRLVIGNPLYRDGSESPQAKTTRMFSRMLATRAVELGLARRPRPFVYLWDERLTSQAARVNIKIKISEYRSADVDSQAACLILEDFYRAKGTGAEVILPDGEEKPLPPAAQVDGGGAASSSPRPPPTPPPTARQSSSTTAPSSPSSSSVSYRDWIEAEKQRYVTGDGGDAVGEGPSSSADSDRKGGRKKKRPPE